MPSSAESRRCNKRFCGPLREVVENHTGAHRFAVRGHMQQAVRTPIAEFDRMFTYYLDQWRLTADGAPIVTRAAHLLPVRRDGEALMLADEKHGGVLLSW